MTPGTPSGLDAAAPVAARLTRGVDDHAGPRNPLRPEPRPVDRLREFGTFLHAAQGRRLRRHLGRGRHLLPEPAPQLAGDRPIIAALLMGPQLLAAVVDDAGWAPRPDWARTSAWFAIGLALAASVITHTLRSHGPGATLAQATGDAAAAARPGPTAPPCDRLKPVERRGDAGQLALFVATFGLFVPAAIAFVMAAAWADTPSGALPWFQPTDSVVPASLLAPPSHYWGRVQEVAAWTIGIPLVGWAIGSVVRAGLARRRARLASPLPPPASPPAADTRPFGPWMAPVIDALGLVLSGAVIALMLGGLLGANLHSQALLQPRGVAILAVPALLVAYAIGRALFGAIDSLNEDWVRGTTVGDDGDREWWARIIGRVLAAAAVWAVLGVVVLYGMDLLQEGWSRLVVLGAGGASAVATALLGKGEETGSGRGSPGSRRRELVMKVVAGVAVACVLALLAGATQALTGFLAEWLRLRFGMTQPLAPQLWGFLAAAGFLVAVSLVSGFFVDVNRFSLHRMYRNRLVRAYLGASNVERRPDPVSGFDHADGSVLLKDCRPRVDGRTRLLPIVNCTLNLLRGGKLGWQERQAESFSMTPLYCGNFYEGYRATAHYGSPRGGISLGSAMAISGAAANPNMGYVSSPALTFLLALLNARLGVWLANPNERGDHVAHKRGPSHATAHLLRELLGLTDRKSPFVNLSDGGHFDNLGLYEVVLRRCRHVVVSDAGCDPAAGYGDLGSVIRRIRVDFGVPIVVEREWQIAPRGPAGELPTTGYYCAQARVLYSRVDGTPPERDGVLVYFKPTLAPWGQCPLPPDVLAYARREVRFPHESTADQWFSESQFESYRALGEHLVATVIGEAPLDGFEAFLARVRTHLDRQAAAEAAAQRAEVTAPARPAAGRNEALLPAPPSAGGEEAMLPAPPPDGGNGAGEAPQRH
ncbi:MAG: hypothetical protein QM767_10960 [Anaeromyxobacter sp.]